MKHSLLGLLVLLGSLSYSAMAETIPFAEEQDALVQLTAKNKKATTVAPDLPEASASVRYVVQLGAFTHKDQALKWQEQLAQDGIQVVLQQDNEDEYAVVRVRSLPFDSKLAAQDMALQLKLYGVQQALIMRVNE
ncbi:MULTISPECIES: SPOR domain-containing protein [Vitreoscilla]|uniref:SPOR domain-containing protein n=1 Tax=Vitreoscilla stercoraria TaxID=61 RepID=A0ABY4ECC1_VITST|nr:MULTISPECIES: SPOR domain-containing protein [Vitreoscilla]AUZ03992.2 hypothetical protein ADP71_01610 [Vitreoscilla sp. C1]UOO93092.1 SPOR domain-containing protein [Vitreoscilla stercoraria]